MPISLTCRKLPTHQPSIKDVSIACPQIRQPCLIRATCSLIYRYIGAMMPQRSTVLFVTWVLLAIRIYGLGVRSGLYIQWVTSLLANHLLREESTALMRSYLIFHIALCIAVAVLTFQKNCTFVVEIVLLYYLVYGGFICVYSRPNLGDFEPATVGLHWSQVVLILSFFTMVLHVVWLVVFDHFSLPDMPCETTIFFFGPVKGPWMDVWLLWLAVNLLAIIFLVVSGTTLCLCAFCFIYAIKILVSVVQSILYRDLFLRVRYRLAAQPDSIRNKYGSALFRYFRAYTMSRPVHGQQRRCIPVFKGLCVRH